MLTEACDGGRLSSGSLVGRGGKPVAAAFFRGRPPWLRWCRGGVIPMALIADRFAPLASGDRGEAVGRRQQPVPGVAAGGDDRLVVGPDAQAELVLPQVLPEVLKFTGGRSCRRAGSAVAWWAC